MESLSDIETELRTLSQSSKYCELQPTVSGKSISFYFAEIADRIKAAAPTTEKSSAVGNAAAMREALEAIRNLAYEVQDMNREGDGDVRTSVPATWVIDIVSAALAAPPRNCDVGTAEEQDNRMDVYCQTRKCESCPLWDNVNNGVRCEFAWAQMPYEAEEGGTE